jgi:manganese efflux pump family protein
VLKLLLFVIPLGLDTFAVSAALGVAGVKGRNRLRVSLVMSAFELAMPVVGLLLGRGLGAAIGDVADYLAIAVLTALGVWMTVHEEAHEGRRAAGIAGGQLLATVGIGISISVDELAMGFTIGLLHLNLWFAVALIGAQAFLFAQLGLRLGARLNEKLREGAERLAGVALIGLAAVLAVEQLTGG